MNRNKSHFEDKEPLFENLLRWFRYIKIISYIKSGSKILDLGCGYNAELSRFVSKKGCNYFGLDISVNKNKNKEKICLLNSDIDNGLPFEDKSFDIVISLANLEHLNNPEFNIKEIYRVLKDNRVVLLTTPSIYSKPILELLSFKFRLISEEEIKDHKNYFNRDILTRMFKNAGFSSVRHKYFQFFMNNFVAGIK